MFSKTLTTLGLTGTISKTIVFAERCVLVYLTFITRYSSVRHMSEFASSQCSGRSSLHWFTQLRRRTQEVEQTPHE